MVKTKLASFLMVLMLCAGSAHAIDIASINVGEWVIDVYNKPVEDIALTITGGADLTDMVLRVQVADGGPELGGSINGPEITALNYSGSIWETAPSGYANFPSGGLSPGDKPQVVEDNMSLNVSGETVLANGTFVTITIDASEFSSIPDISSENPLYFDFKLADTVAGYTSFFNTDVTINNGTIKLIPEPASLSLMLLGTLAAFRKRKS